MSQTESLRQRSTSIQMLYQCPGCWSYSTNTQTRGGYECDCGERLTLIDLRARTSDGPHGKHWTEDEG